MFRIDTDDAVLTLEKKPEIWRELFNAHLFITGGTGWIGKNLIEAIHLANQELGSRIKITILTRDSQKFALEAPHLKSIPELCLYQSDIRNIGNPPGDFTHIIHAATTSANETYNGIPQNQKFEMLIDGTRSIIKLAKQKKVRNLLFTSSGAVYGQTSKIQHIKENESEAPDLLDTNTALGQGKRAAEFLLALFQAESGSAINIARCFSFIGPHMPLDLHYAAGNFIKAAHDNNPIIIKGDGSAIRSYLYTRDLAIWLLKILTNNNGIQIFNTGATHALSLIELATTVKESLNSRSTITVEGNANQSIGTPYKASYLPCTKKARAQLGLNEWTDIRKSIKKTSNSIDRQNKLNHQ